MRIIVTGGMGYIGSHLVSKLDGDILVADKKCGIDITNDFYQKYKDFKPDLIYHLAAQSEVQTNDPVGMVKDNILGTLEIAKFNCPVVFASSCGVYGNTNRKSLETDTLNPENIYTMTKMIGEKILEGKTILRFSNVYGDGGRGVYEKLIQGSSINGDGNATRDFIHVSDIVSALMKFKDSPGIYNIGTSIETSINELADILGVEKKYAPAVKEQKRSCVDITKSLKMGWKPTKKLC